MMNKQRCWHCPLSQFQGLLLSLLLIMGKQIKGGIFLPSNPSISSHVWSTRKQQLYISTRMNRHEMLNCQQEFRQIYITGLTFSLAAFFLLNVLKTISWYGLLERTWGLKSTVTEIYFHIDLMTKATKPYHSLILRCASNKTMRSFRDWNQ